MKKILMTFIIVLVVTNLHAISKWDGSNSPWTRGNGSKQQPYLIESAQHLAYLAEMVSNGGQSYTGKYFELTTDIDLNKKQWVPIGGSETSNIYFEGYFNGNNHTISNLYTTAQRSSNGLFGCIKNAKIMNIRFSGAYVYVSSNLSIRSGICCGSSVNSDIDSIYIDSKSYLYSKSKNQIEYSYAGGIAGYASGTVSNCTNYGSIHAESKLHSYCGGIIGKASSTGVLACTNYGEVESFASEIQSEYTPEAYAGGITAESGDIYNSANHGKVCAKAQTYYNYTMDVGGISGYNSSTNIKCCCNTDSVIARYCGYSNGSHNNQYKGESRAGGIIGRGSVLITYCYNRGVVTVYATESLGETGCVGGIVGKTTIGQALQVKNSYNVGYLSVVNARKRLSGIIGDGKAWSYTSSNSYFSSTCGGAASGTEVKTESAMRGAAFPNTLNNDSTAFFLDQKNVNDGFPIFEYQIPITYGKITGHAQYGYIKGTGTYKDGTIVTLEAIPDDFCHFVQWGDGDKNLIKQIVVSGDTTYTALFAIDSFTVETYGEHGTISGGGTYEWGTTITLRAIPDEHYHFVKWGDGNKNSTRQVIVSGDLDITAIFEANEYAITLVGVNGAVSGSGTYQYDTKVTISATAHEHYHFVSWNDGNKESPREVVVESDTTYEAIFAIDQHTVSIVGKVYGTISGGGTYDYGTTITLSVHPDEHYHFVQWSDGNKNATRTLLVNKDITLSVEFSVDQYSILGSGEHGIVSGTGICNYGDTITLVAIPDEHYHFVKWSDGVTTASREVEVKATATYIAEFAIDQHLITVLGKNGTVDGSGMYDYGEEVTLTATPDEHYHFVNWLDGATTSTRKIIVSGDAKYTAVFAIDQFTITVSSVNGSITGGGTYDYGTNIILEAIPDEHYHFVKWSDGDTNTTRAFVITKNETISAVFAINQYEITCGGEHGTITGGGLYDYGTQIILYAISDEHYHFVKWSDGEELQSRSIIVTENANYSALFEADLFTIQVKSINETMGSVLGSGQYPYDSDVMITAISNNGYEFSKWSDGNKENPRSIHISKNAQYVATFTPKNYSILVLSSDEVQGSVIGSGEYAYNTTITIEAIPNVGYSFLQWDDGNTDNPRMILITDDAIFIAQFIRNTGTNINEPIINIIETCKYIKDNHLVIQCGDKYYDARGVRIN